MKKQLFQKPTATPHSLRPSTPVSTYGDVVFEQRERSVAVNDGSANILGTVEQARGKQGLRRGFLDEGCSRGGTKGSRGGSTGSWEGDGDDSGRGGEKLRGGTGRGRGRGGGRGQRKRSSTFGEEPSPDDVLQRKRELAKVYNKVNETSSVYAQPNQELRGTQRLLLRIKSYAQSQET